jgi:hypothetical protein
MAKGKSPPTQGADVRARYVQRHRSLAPAETSSEYGIAVASADAPTANGSADGRRKGHACAALRA